MQPENDYIDVNTVLKSFVGPWYESLENPVKAQETALLDLIRKYCDTDYGKSHNAQKTSNIVEFQANFPIIDYQAMKPYLKQKETTKRSLLRHLKLGS
jgi:hypothetical protein